ncbi:MAG: hypothetical protein M1835_000734 [Candelina submexicana]|nr:MAG: hypothetical protein M1835_000734 [Candelina submexicana]
MSAIAKSARPATAPDLDVLGDQVTIHPSGYTESHAHDGEPQERNLVEHMARFRDAPLDFLREISLHVWSSGTGWRAYEDVIGQPIFYPGFSEKMKNMVLSTPMLQRKIEALAERRLEVEQQQGLLDSQDRLHTSKRAQRRYVIEQSLQEVAQNAANDMICKFESKSFIRGAYYLCLALPTVVAGDNLNLKFVGGFLQHAGAMWIRRSFGDDTLYTTLVQSYIDTLLQNGYNFECFIEGGRSRTGKLLPPKFGILSFLLDSVLSGRVHDAIICPVSTQYDKVIETESYISELLGQPKPKESLRDFLSASSVLSLQLGRVDVRFHEPWSLKHFISQQQIRSSTIAHNDTKTADVKTTLLRTLGYRVLSEINEVSVVMPTALIGTVLLTLRGRGVGKPELVRRVEWLSERIRAQGGRVAHFAGIPTGVVVDRGLEVLGQSLVGRVEGLAEETFYAVDRFQLSFYRNMTIHLFISEALVSASMYKGGGPDHQRVRYEALLDQVSFLSSLFRDEFIFSTEGLEYNIKKTIRGLAADNVITVRRTEKPHDSTDDILAIELSDAERLCGRENFDFYCFLIWPFIEASWLGAVSLMGLTPPTSQMCGMWLDLRDTQDRAQLLGKTLYHQGDLSYFEAVNKETLKNAYQRFEEEGIIEVTRYRNRDVPPKLRLASSWVPNREPSTGKVVAGGRLWVFIEKIAQSRREVTNRRDGATVATRVLQLADKLGQGLFDSASLNPGSEWQDKDTAVGKRRGKAMRATAHI